MAEVIMRRRTLFVFLALAIGSCVPAVPYDQMPGYNLAGGAASSHMTADAALRQAEYQEQMLTATAQMPAIQMTSTAAALSVQGTQAAATSIAGQQTQAAAMTSTAVWWTPTAIPTATANLTATLDALAIEAAQTQTTLNLRRNEANNDFQAKLPAYSFGIVVLVLAIVLMWVSRRQRYRFAETDARGNVLPVMDVVQGTFTDMDRSPNYKGSVSRDLLVRLIAHMFEKKYGIPLELPAVTASRQDATTERDQMIDLASRGLPAVTSDAREMKKLAGQQMVKQMSDTNLETRFKILDGSGDHLDLIDGQIIQVLDEDWKEAVRS